MTDPKRLQKLLDSLAAEIGLAQANSHQSQFPILDLLGNIRDLTDGAPDLAALHATCAEAWERVVVIVESGKPFTAAEVEWLRAAAEKLQLPSPDAAPQPMQSAPPPPTVARAEPDAGTFVLDLNQDADLLREFVNESREHLDNIEQGVLVLEHQPTDAEMLNTIFRAFHTFKGSAGALNLMPINRLAHGLESLLDLARQGKLAIDRRVIDLILRGRDVLKQALEEIERQLNGASPAVPIALDAAHLQSEVMAVVSGEHAPVGPPGAPVDAGPSVIALPLDMPASPSTPEIKPAAEARTSPAMANDKPPTRAAERGAVVKVDTGKLDALLDLVGEMVIAQSLVAQDLAGLAGLKPEFVRNLAQLSRTTKELQRVSMAMRMVPIRGAFQKMVRVVRDVSARQQKQVELLTSGEDTEVDRNMVEALNDPLLHMIRNSIDHGIESPDQRASRGKPAMAAIHLRAYHQGGNIVIEIEDDGAGLNRDRILAKAIDRGLATPNNHLTDEEIYNFIFAAGFSTAEKVTDLSGRGVGLDVVRRNVETLRGCVDIASTPGRGTVFKITLPLTLAIIDGLIVKVSEERYIVPTLSVRESFRPRADMISRVQGAGEVVNVRGRLLPLLRLYEFFGLAPASTDPTDGIVVVIQSGSSFRALLVDNLLHKQEVVIKNLNDLMVHKNRFLAGAAILGDGRVGLILDVNALVHGEKQALRKAA
jgi:two-component system, chemotaxis family, sensor kinase CheA